MSQYIKRDTFFVLAIGLLISVALIFVFPYDAVAQSNGSVAKTKVELEAELVELEREIAAQQMLLDGKTKERVSVERDVAILTAKISRAKLEIRQRNIVISGLGSEIKGKEAAIGSLNEKLERQKESLAQLIRKTNEIDDFTIVEIVLSSKSISDFFEDIDSFNVIRNSLNESFLEIEKTKTNRRAEKESLEGKQSEELELRRIQELQKKKIEIQEDEKQDILDITKGEEAVYESVLESTKKSAAEIRVTLFTLRGTAAIPFEQAYQHALDASAFTGVRPALILGVIAQESNLGENVGQCVITNEPNKGDGKGINTGRHFSGVMKPDRDVDPFFSIVNKLGINPYSQVVSCPPSYGYGGAMGPAQFIPSTWILYEDRVGRAVREVPPNPWNPRTAFMASAILMMDNGADRGGYYSERLAALRYFAGWRNAEKPAYAFYGDGVMELADKYQGLINIVERG